MLLLIIAVAALAAGPLLVQLAQRAKISTAALDGFVMVTIGGLVVVHIVPHAWASAGPAVAGMAVIGFLGPGLVERFLSRAASKAHTATLVFATLGLAVHALVDGVALAVPEEQHGEGSVLALAVAMHRLPVALTVWWLVTAAAGRKTAASALGAIAVATLVGYFGADAIVSTLDSEVMSFFQAFVAGSLLHVVFHQPTKSIASTAPTRAASGAGALLGLLVVIGLADTHLPHQGDLEAVDFSQTFMALLLETAPALLIAFALAGLVQVFMPQASRKWLHTGRASTESVRGVVFGLPLPICSCGVIPLYDTLVRQGVPATAAMSFLVATPELGIDAVLISIPLLGVKLTVIRVVCAFLIAVAVGWLIGRLANTWTGNIDTSVPSEARGSFRERVRSGLRFGFRDVVDDTGPWIVVGLIVASLAEPLLREGWLSELPVGLDVFLFAALGIPVYVCASGATPLAAVLIHKGVSPGAAIAFLLAGPATNITTFGILRKLHSTRIALGFGGAIAGLAIGLGLLVNLGLGDAEAIPLHTVAHEDASILALMTVFALALVYTLSLLRLGPRGFVDQIVSPLEEEGDHDDCGHHH
jgi:uncharacterized membrane protein YraQ (UPF0718 family)